MILEEWFSNYKHSADDWVRAFSFLRTGAKKCLNSSMIWRKRKHSININPHPTLSVFPDMWVPKRRLINRLSCQHWTEETCETHVIKISGLKSSEKTKTNKDISQVTDESNYKHSIPIVGAEDEKKSNTFRKFASRKRKSSIQDWKVGRVIIFTAAHFQKNGGVKKYPIS